jgi:hypothetical protein
VTGQVPGSLSYQGILLQDDGITPISDDTYGIEFRFYDASDVYQFSRGVSVTTAKGLFTCVIGDGSAPYSTFTNDALDPGVLGSQQFSIGIIVEGGAELAPRAKLTTAAYAFQAQSAYTISDNAVTSAKIADATITDADVADVSASKISGITTGVIPKGNGSALVASQIFDDGTRVGIGTISPQSRLHLYNGTLRIESSAPYIDFSETDLPTNYFRLVKDSDKLQIRINNGSSTPPLSISNNGFFGIGTPNPAYQLEVNGEIASRSSNGFRFRQANYSAVLRNDNVDFYLLQTAAGDPDGAWNAFRPFSLNFATGNVSINGISALENGNVGIGTVSPQGRLHVGSTMETSNSIIVESYNPTISNGASSSKVVLTAGKALATPESKSYILRFERGRGMTTSLENFYLEDESGADILAVNNRTIFRPGTDNSMSLGSSSYRWTAVYAADGTINTSDSRLKRDVMDLQYGLGQVLRLRPVSFAWRNDKTSKQHLGLIAQEVLKVAPEVVDAPTDGFYGLNYSELTPILIKAIQEQQSQIEELRNTNNFLERRLAAVEAGLSGTASREVTATKSEKP